MNCSAVAVAIAATTTIQVVLHVNRTEQSERKKIDYSFSQNMK